MYKNNDLLVCGKYYNTSDVFKINEDAQISVEKFGDQKVVVVDDFYSNPEMVRDISLNSYASKYDNVEYPGFRNTLYTNLEFQLKFFTNLIEDNYDRISLYHETFNKVNFNLVKSAEVYDWDYDSHGRACHPHIDKADKCKYGAVVYLNHDDEFTAGVNGTSFYKHKATSVCDCNPKIMKFYRRSGYRSVNDVFFTDETAHCNDWINDGNEYWDMIHLSQMKFNRMILYPGTYFHASYFNNDDFNNPNPATGHRIVQAMFLRGVN